MALVEEVTNMITNSDAVIMGTSAEGLSSYPIRALICLVEDIQLVGWYKLIGEAFNSLIIVLCEGVLTHAEGSEQ